MKAIEAQGRADLDDGTVPTLHPSPVHPRRIVTHAPELSATATILKTRGPTRAEISYGDIKAIESRCSAILRIQ
jgi:hypothetical protein